MGGKQLGFSDDEITTATLDPRSSVAEPLEADQTRDVSR